MSEKDRDDRRSSVLPRRKQDRQILSIRYRAQAAELRQLAKTGPLDEARRQRMLEFAVELEQLAERLEHPPADTSADRAPQSDD